MRTGSTFKWKTSGCYELADWLVLRGFYSTGFRAPTPGQSNIRVNGIEVSQETRQLEASQAPG